MTAEVEEPSKKEPHFITDVKVTHGINRYDTTIRVFPYIHQ